MIVHLPLALAVLMPLAAAAVLLSWWRGWLPGRRSWALVLALQAALLASGVAALRTGEAEEDRVEPVVAERALEAHEEAAEVFVTAAGVVLALFVLPLLVPGEGLKRGAAALATAATLAVAAFAVRVGEAGGELVYRHGAAAVYARADAPTAPAATAATGPRRLSKSDKGEHDDD